MRFVWVVVTLLLVTWLALGQAPSPAPAAKAAPAAVAAPAASIAVVSADRVMAESAEGKVVLAELERKFAPRQKELQARAAEVDKLQAEFQQKQKSLERLNEDVTSEFNSAREESVGRLAKRVGEVVQKYGAEKQYFLILDAGAAGALYIGAGADITNEILAAYNQAYPVKSGQ